jgi:hypothetical protein
MSFNYERWKEEQYSAPAVGRRAAVALPAAAFWAGMIWAVVGLIHLLAVPVIALKLGKPGSLAGLVFLGLVHLYWGFRTMNGTAAGTVRNGIMSIAYGLLWVVVAGVGAKQGTNPNAPLVALGLGAFGGALLLAGSLAMIASASYQRWRRAN